MSPGEHRPEDRPARPGGAARGQHVQAHDAEDDEGHTGRSQRREALVEHEERHDRDQRHPQAASDRIDERVGSGPVRAAQRVEVQRVEQDRAGHEWQRRGTQAISGENPGAER